MMKTKRMTRISIVGPKNVMSTVISELHDMSLLHIKDYVKMDDNDDFDIGAPLDASDRISRTVVKLRSIESNLSKGKIKKWKSEDIDKVDETISKIETEIVENIEASKTLEDEKSKLNAILLELSAISCLSLTLDVFSEYDSLKYIVGYTKEKNIDVKIKNVSENYKIYRGEHDKKTIVAIFVDKDNASDVQQVLNEVGFSEINMSQLSGLTGTIESNIDEIKAKIRKIDDKIGKIDKNIARISDKWGSYIKSNEKHLSRESEKMQAPLRFAESENVFIINGWIPSEKIDTMDDQLHKATDEKIFVKKYDDVGEAPIVLDNKGPAKSFGFFMDLYALPSYKEIDPTFFMFIMFPIFFGFMLGDWGYGVLTLAIFTALRFKVPKMKDILNVMIIASISTIVFGLLYDEFFGIELFHEMGIHFPHLLSRANSEGANLLIVYALGLGILHIITGYVIGFFNEMRMHGFKAAILEKISWIVFMAGFFPALLAFFNMGDYIPQYRNILLVSGILMIIWGEGIKGALELISPLTNVLSYARLMAVGLASVILAEVVNEMAHPMFDAGLLGFAMGTVVLVAGHSINICLGLMSPFIHSMRLHYVEFFLKFYHGGGKKYTPFGLREDI